MNKEQALEQAIVNFDGDTLAANVFFKYSLMDDNDKYKETSLKQMYKRLYETLNECEAVRFNSDVRFNKLFDNFIFAGRILYALGNPYDNTATYSNCYVTEIGEDNLESIFETAKKQARVFSKGGGIGFDISTLRPRGASVNNSAKTTTGSVSFMDLYSLVTGLIGQHGRRGALMLSISVKHPDLIDFIKVKGGEDKSKVKYANISIRITDDFMQALLNNQDWTMEYTLKDGSVFTKTESAAFIWSLLVESNRVGAEPGILFWDNILKYDPSSIFDETRPISTNPCLTDDTWILTSSGSRQIKDLIGTKFTAIVNGESHESTEDGFFFTGKKEVYEVKTKEGYNIKGTSNHRFLVDRNGVDEWTEVRDLNIGDKMLISNNTGINNLKLTATVVSITNVGEFDTYDATIPGPHEFSANGFRAHNCAEEPLEKGGACALASMNLNTFVLNSFTENAKFDFDKFISQVKLSVRALDNIVEMNLDRHPLEENVVAARLGRRIGLGFTGLADMLIRMNYVYDSDEAIAFVEQVASVFKKASIEASIDLAIERGPFELLNIAPKDKVEEFKQHDYFSILDDEYKVKLNKYGIRNVGINTVAPNGSISIILRTSSGLEPIFNTEYERTVQQGGKPKVFTTYHPLVLEYNKIYGDNAHRNNKLFVTANEIDWIQRVKMQSVIQKHISQSISSTINLPAGTTNETISNIYMEAWKNKLKGCTVYVDKSREGVLNNKSDASKNNNDVVREVLENTKFPDEADGKLKILKSEGRKWYVWYTLDEDNIPNSLFVNTNSVENNIHTEGVLQALEKLARKYKLGKYVDDLFGKFSHQANVIKITRMLSLLLRHRVQIIEITKTIEKINPSVYSFIFRINKLLISFLDGHETGNKCKKCGGKLVFEAGCSICRDCGDSKCG